MYKKFGSTSLLVNAIVRRDMLTSEDLLAAGADPNEPDENGWLPLHAAIGHYNLPASTELVAKLIDRGADVNAWDANHHETPIISACDPPNLAIAKLLLDEGAETNVRRSDGETPLLLSVAAQDIETAKVLLHHGAAKTIDQIGGPLAWSALSHAASNFDIPMIELLLQAGADPAAVGEYDETARDALPPRKDHDPDTWDRVLEMLSRKK